MGIWWLPRALPPSLLHSYSSSLGVEPSVYLVSVRQQSLFYFIFLSKFKSFQLQLTYDILISGVQYSDEIVM